MDTGLNLYQQLNEVTYSKQTGRNKVDYYKFLKGTETNYTYQMEGIRNNGLLLIKAR